jgi:hypothetical protein
MEWRGRLEEDCFLKRDRAIPRIRNERIHVGDVETFARDE